MPPGGMANPPSPGEIEDIKNQIINQQMQQIPQFMPQGLEGMPGQNPGGVFIAPQQPEGMPGGGQMQQAPQAPQNAPEPLQNVPIVPPAAPEL